MNSEFEIFAVAVPGLERPLLAEVQATGFRDIREIAGGVRFSGGWSEVWRANLELRGASRILARMGEFRAFHLAQLDKRSRKFPWGNFLSPSVPVRVEASSHKSKIYHAGAAAQRVERAITEELGAPISPKAELVVKVRIDDNLVTLSLDTSGEGLHKRGHKQAVGKAPIRETMAAMFLRMCDFKPEEPLFDPMCGSGTFVIEAAEMALGMQAGRARRFAFEDLPSFEADSYAGLKRSVDVHGHLRFFGSDRDAGAIKGARTNAERAGVSELTQFEQRTIGDIKPPCTETGLVIVNPPYGARIGNKRLLYALYGTLGARLREEFGGWRVGIITSDAALARATGLSFRKPGAPISNGGIKVNLFYSDKL